MSQIYPQKDSNLSSKIRKEANGLYKDLNSSYDPEKYLKVITEYSKSLAVAPKQTAEYALALSNRSAVLFSNFKFDNCMLDVDAALQNSEDHALRFKLLCRKIECLINLGQSKNIREYFDKALRIADLLDEKLTDNIYLEKLASIFEKDRKIFTKKSKENNNVSNFISTAISWHYNEKFGNHLLANRDINVGEKLIIEDFYCGFPEIDQLHIICSYCLSVTLNSIPCDSCAQAVFCSNKCKKLAWEKFHDIECDIYQGLLKNLNLPSMMRNTTTMIRLFLIALKETGSLKNLIDKVNEIDNARGKYKTIFTDALVKKKHKAFDFVFGLARADRNLIQGGINFYEEICRLVIVGLLKSKYFANQDILKNVDLLKRVFINLLNIIHANNFGVSVTQCNNTKDLFMLKCGTVLMPTLSLVNHSCKPNCTYIFTKNSKLILYAEKPIKKNEQIFITYDNNFENNQEKQNIFLKGYGFKCECIACEENWEEESLPKNLETLRFKHKNIYEFYQSINANVGRNFEKEFDEEGNIKKLESTLCKIIENGYRTLSIYDAELALKGIKDDLRIIYSKLYGKDVFDTYEVLPKKK